MPGRDYAVRGMGVYGRIGKAFMQPPPAAGLRATRKSATYGRTAKRAGQAPDHAVNRWTI